GMEGRMNLQFGWGNGAVLSDGAVLRSKLISRRVAPSRFVLRSAVESPAHSSSSLQGSSRRTWSRRAWSRPWTNTPWLRPARTDKEQARPSLRIVSCWSFSESFRRVRVLILGNPADTRLPGYVARVWGTMPPY